MYWKMIVSDISDLPLNASSVFLSKLYHSGLLIVNVPNLFSRIILSDVLKK